MKYTRVEVIGPTGRILIAHPCVAEVSEQDGGRTLKVFLDREPILWTQAERDARFPALLTDGEKR